jgi:hypothetical protein
VRAATRLLALARARLVRAMAPLALALALLPIGARAGRTGARRPAARSAPAARGDSAAAMSLQEAALMAVQLLREHRAYASLPYYRRVALEMRPSSWEFHLEFASALQSAALDTRSGVARASALARASDERVELTLDALAELARAELAAPEPRARAQVIVVRAFFLRIWGFPLDALAELRRALKVDPSYPDLVSTTKLMARWLREPTIPAAEMARAEREARGARDRR